MKTLYTHTLTLAVPSNLLTQANHLALQTGESPGDINTFTRATYTDGTTDYAVAHTVCTDTLLVMLASDSSGPLREGVDGAMIVQAMEALKSGEALMAVDVDPHEQFLAWGLAPIPTDTDLL